MLTKKKRVNETKTAFRNLDQSIIEDFLARIKDVNLKIIYEDSDIIVIDKPTKILTISNSKEKEKTFLF